MPRVNVLIPESLHEWLLRQADAANLEVGEFIVRHLEHSARNGPPGRIVEHDSEDVALQEKKFQELLESLGKATPEEIESALATRGEGDGPELDPRTRARLRERIEKSRSTSRD